jgi:hypothetical protein
MLAQRRGHARVGEETLLLGADQPAQREHLRRFDPDPVGFGLALGRQVNAEAHASHEEKRQNGADEFPEIHRARSITGAG